MKRACFEGLGEKAGYKDITLWKWQLRTFPTMRGVFDWSIHIDVFVCGQQKSFSGDGLSVCQPCDAGEKHRSRQQTDTEGKRFELGRQIVSCSCKSGMSLIVLVVKKLHRYKNNYKKNYLGLICLRNPHKCISFTCSQCITKQNCRLPALPRASQNLYPKTMFAATFVLKHY